MTPVQIPDSGIRDSEGIGEPLNSACAPVCEAGNGFKVVDDTNMSTSSRPKCAPCDAGSHSVGGKAAKCQLCQPGRATCVFVCANCIVSRTKLYAGYFQPEQGQFRCISCDSLGSFYQVCGTRAGNGSSLLPLPFPPLPQACSNARVCGFLSNRSC
jgi:hypothetical protein